MKIRPVGAELFHADVLTDRQTDKTNITATFFYFANAADKQKIKPLLMILFRPPAPKINLHKN
jgi:hypothetical protein